MSKTILIIDDDTRNIFALSAVLKAKCFDCLTATSAPEGIELLRSNRQGDVVLMDIMMPDMDGFEVCKKLRENDQDIPIIFLTAKKSDFDMIVGLEIGADDYLLKPFNPRELLARIKTCMPELRTGKLRLSTF